MSVHATLHFYGHTEEAINFYCRAIGAKTLSMTRFRDCTAPTRRMRGFEEKIFHASFCIESTVITASDSGCEKKSFYAKHLGFSVVLKVETPKKAKQIFTGLSDGGAVLMPLVKTPSAEQYGVVVDRFGMSWKILVEPGTSEKKLRPLRK